MNTISQLFFSAVLINVVIFFSLAFLLSIIQIFLHRKRKAPLCLNKKSFFSILLVAFLVNLSFYLLIFKTSQGLFLSSELFLQRIEIFIILAGIIGGLINSAITHRIAFIENCWITFIQAFSMVFLKDWAGTIFSYGTSSAYFITVILSSTILYLVLLSFGSSLGFLLFGEGRFNPYFKYESFVGLRFLMAKRSSQVISLITVISIVAITFACSGMIIVMSVMNGFADDIRSKILGANPHLMVFKYGGEFLDYKRVIEKTGSIEGILSANPFVLSEGMVLYNKNLSGALITGLDVSSIKKSDKLSKYISEEALNNLQNPKNIKVPIDAKSFDDEAVNKKAQINDLPGVILGKEMANHMQVFIGDIVSLVNPLGDIGPTGPMPLAKPFRVAGLFYSGMNEYDSKFAYIRLDHAQDFFNLKNGITGIEYVLADIEKTKSIAKKVDEAIGGYPFYTRDWIQMNRPMFSALQLEKIAMLLILGTLILMSSLLILVTLIMVVMEKGKEIAILKSMGATNVSIMKIFVIYGLIVGGIGAFLGGFLGFAICGIIDKIGIRLDPDVYYISNLPIKVENLEVLFVILAAILISFLATIPPSLFAARLKPVEGLRYE